MGGRDLDQKGAEPLSGFCPFPPTQCSVQLDSLTQCCNVTAKQIFGKPLHGSHDSVRDQNLRKHHGLGHLAFIISYIQTSSPKPQSWTGYWNTRHGACLNLWLTLQGLCLKMQPHYRQDDDGRIKSNVSPLYTILLSIAWWCHPDLLFFYWENHTRYRLPVRSVTFLLCPKTGNWKMHKTRLSLTCQGGRSQTGEQNPMTSYSTQTDWHLTYSNRDPITAW